MPREMLHHSVQPRKFLITVLMCSVRHAILLLKSLNYLKHVQLPLENTRDVRENARITFENQICMKQMRREKKALDILVSILTDLPSLPHFVGVLHFVGNTDSDKDSPGRY